MDRARMASSLVLWRVRNDFLSILVQTRLKKSLPEQIGRRLYLSGSGEMPIDVIRFVITLWHLFGVIPSRSIGPRVFVMRRVVNGAPRPRKLIVKRRCVLLGTTRKLSAPNVPCDRR